jgi:DME family drug/metabolite transporter
VIDPKLMALLTALGFGIGPVLLKVAFRHGGAMTVGLVVGQVCTVVLNLALLAVMDPRVDLLTPLAVVAFAAGGLAGTAIGRRWAYESINLLGPARSTTIRSASPVITTLLAIVFLGEQVDILRWAAILAVVLGAALVSWQPGAGARGWMGLGVAYSLAAAAIYGVRPLIVKVGLDAAAAPLSAAIIGASAALLYTLIFEDRRQLRSLRLDRAFAWFVISGVFQALGVTALSFGLSAGDASVVYSLTASAPLFTILFTWIVIRDAEPITLRLIAGAALVVGGVVYL